MSKQKRGDIYVTENLSPESKSLLWECKQWCLKNDYKYSWYNNCKIFIKKDDNGIPKRIKSKNELNNLLPDK